MQDHDTAPPQTARAADPKQACSLSIEEELFRLYRARPELADRIDRASSLVVRQLSSPPRLSCIRVRVGRSGARFLVDSSTTPGAIYTVDPRRGFRCSCPDAISRGPGCKHSLAAWLLWRVSLSRDRGTCSGCGLRFRRGELVELHEGNHDDLTYFHGDLLCSECADAAGVEA